VIKLREYHDFINIWNGIIQQQSSFVQDLKMPINITDLDNVGLVYFLFFNN